VKTEKDKNGLCKTDLIEDCKNVNKFELSQDHVPGSATRIGDVVAPHSGNV
jgi:hypothetical protein